MVQYVPPLPPVWAMPATIDKISSYVDRTGAGTFRQPNYAVLASLNANAELHCRWKLWSTLPTGTPKLLLSWWTPATSGVGKVNPKWVFSTANSSSIDRVSSMTAEGTTTLTANATGDILQEDKITLDAFSWTGAANKWLDMVITFETTGWTLASLMHVQRPCIIWE